jgi:hypothetical protein
VEWSSAPSLYIRDRSRVKRGEKSPTTTLRSVTFTRHQGS